MRPLSPLPDWVALEHSVAQILTQQEIHGWYFNERSAWELESSLRTELEDFTQLLRNRHPFVAGSIFTPRRNNQTLGYVEATGRTEKHEHCKEIKEIQECSFTKLKELNPTSRDHIAWVLTTHHGWNPSLISSNGKPVVATNTFRCSHRRPNLSQVPADERFRKLFTASPRMVMVGADLAGIELRMLAHYLARYDGGRYADILLNGDIHQVNADKIGISRRDVKTVTYAFLYGAGDVKIGLSVDKQLSTNKARARGKQVRAAFIEAIDGLSELLQAVKKRSASGTILAIDGRKIFVESQHKALNYLLQCSAGIIAKRWLKITHDNKPPTAHQLAFVHDELQYECKKEDVEDLMFLLECSALHAGEYYNLRIPIAAEAKSGATWAEVH